MKQNANPGNRPSPTTTDVSEITVHWMKAQPMVEAFVYSAIRDFQAAEDVVQQVAVASVENFAQWNGSASFSTWAVGIAKNKVRMYLRKKSNDRHVFDDQTLSNLVEAYESLEPRVDPMKEALQLCIKQLQGRSRQLIEMRYLSGLTPASIAEEVGLSRNNVFVTLHRVRIALGKCIKTRIGGEERP